MRVGSIRGGAYPPRVRVEKVYPTLTLPLVGPRHYWNIDVVYIYIFDFDVSKHCLDQDYANTSLVEILSV